MFLNNRFAQNARHALKRSRMIVLMSTLMLSMSLVACGDDDTPKDNNTAATNNDHPDAGPGDPDATTGDPDAATGDPDAATGDPDAATGDPDGEDSEPTDLEIIGVYDNNFGGLETITELTWTTESDAYPAQILKIDSFDNAGNFAITQNPADDEYAPNTFNKVVWTDADADGVFYTCTVDYGLDTAADAEASAEVADASNPEVEGCAGFSWTKLSPHRESAGIEIAGIYDSVYGGVETITDTTWETASDAYPAFFMRVDSFDNAQNIAITQNIADENYTSVGFNKIVWIEPDADGVFYYCTVDYELESAEAAAASVEVADESAPEAGGCGGYPWTKLLPKDAA